MTEQQAPSKSKTARSSPPPDAGHIPMTEEMDSAKWTLPPFKVVGLGLLVFGALFGLAFLLAKPPAAAEGSIDNVVAVSLPANEVMVGINVNFINALEKKTFYLRGARAVLVKADGQELTDTAASSVDFDRYFQAFPELKQNAIDALRPELKLQPGERARGMIIVTFPVDKAEFERRKSLAVVLDPYDHLPVVINAKK